MKDTVEQELALALAESSEWHGSPVRMWGEIKPRLVRSRPWWMQARTWSVASVAVVLLLVGVIAGPGLDGLNGWRQQPPDVGNPGNGHEYQPLPGEMHNPGRKHPHVLPVQITVEQPGDVLPGTEATLNIDLTVREGIRLAPDVPVMSVIRFGGNNPVYSTPVEGLAGLELAAGASRTVNATIRAPQQPGWYVTSLKLQWWNQGNWSTLTVGGEPFFVSYPLGSVHVGSVSPATAVVKTAGHTLKVSKVELTAEKTLVYFTLSDVMVPASFDLALQAGGERLQGLGLEQREAAGCAEAIASFGPTPVDATTLLFTLTNLQEVGSNGMVTSSGSWQVAIPLK